MLRNQRRQQKKVPTVKASLRFCINAVVAAMIATATLLGIVSTRIILPQSMMNTPDNTISISVGSRTDYASARAVTPTLVRQRTILTRKETLDEHQNVSKLRTPIGAKDTNSSWARIPPPGRSRKQTIEKYHNASQQPVGDAKKYLCLTDMFGGHCNRILTLARAKRMATEYGLSFALTNRKEHRWFKAVLERNVSIITLPGEHQTLECVKNVTSKRAYYNNFQNERRGNPFVAELAKYFLPYKFYRKKAEKAVAKMFRGKPFLSVHRRQFPRCEWRSTDGLYGRNVGGGANCSKEIMVEHCDLTYDKVQKRYNPTNLPVVLFTDGRNKSLDDTFPTKDDNDFITQLWMMTLSERHIGVPVSTVDAVVNHWRFAGGKRFIEPAGCYNDFDEVNRVLSSTLARSTNA